MMKDNKIPLGAKIAAGAAIILGSAALFAAKVISSGRNTEIAEYEPDDEDYNEDDDCTYEYISPIRKKEYNGRVPSGCAACGGPYPMCTDGCPLFDDD